MAEVVGVKIQVESNASESVGSLKKQLREAQADVQALSDKFGATSVQAVQAAKKAAELKDRIGDAKALTDAFNPDRKFQAFASALTGVVGGISAVQGAMGLLGVENEAVEKTLLKVNSAMALSQGLNSILEARDSFKNLGTVIQSTALFQKANNAATAVAITLQKAFGVATIGTGRAFTILKGAIAATGIGLLVVGLTTLISKISEWTSTTDKAAEAQKKLAEKTELVNAQLQNEIAVLTAVGGKEKEIYNLKVQQTNNELALLRNKFNQQKGLSIEEAKRFGELKTALITLELDEKNRVKKINEDAQKEKDKKDKEASDKAKAVAKERNENLRQRSSDAIEFEREESEQIKRIIDDRIKFIEGREKQFSDNKEKTTKSLEGRITGVVTTSLNDRINIANQLTLSEQDRAKASLQAELNERLKLVDGNAFLETKLKAEYKKKEEDIERASAEIKLGIISNALSTVADAVGRNTAAGKALAVAQAGIDTYAGANKALATYPPPFGAIAAGTVVLAGLLNVKKILATKIPGVPGSSSTTSSVSTPSISSSAPITPALPQATLTQLDQRSINQLGSATNRAYVVESDVTNSQERIRRINRAARLN